MKKLLIVEDEKDFVEMITARAKKLGFQCIIDPHGSLAFEIAKKYAPDAVLVDMNLPKMSGLGVIQCLKTNSELSHIPIIALSAIHDQEVVREALDRGANAYFTKGTDLNVLFTTVHDYLN